MLKRKVIILAISLITLYLLAGTCTAKVTIKLWARFGGPNGIAMLERLIESFEKRYPDIKVELTPMFFHEITPKIIPAFAAGTEPDVFFPPSDLGMTLAREGLLMPLNDFLEKDPSYNFDSFPKAAANTYSINGKVYLSPSSGVGLWVLYGNRRLIEEAGLDSEKPPRYLDEMEVHAKKLTILNSDGTIKRAGYIHLWPNLGCYGLLRQFGSTYFSEEGNKVIPNPDAAVKALTWWRDFAHKVYGRWPDFMPLTQFAGGAFIAETVAYWGDWAMYENRWRLLLRTKEIDSIPDYIAAPIIGPRGKDPLNISAVGSGPVMSKTTKHPDAAWKLIAFWMGPEGQQIFAGFNHPDDAPGLSLDPRVMRATLDSLGPNARKHPAFVAAVQQLKYWRPMETHPLFGNAQSHLGEVASKVATYAVTPEDGARQLVQKLQADLDAYRKAK